MENKTRPFNDLELQVKEKEAELKMLSDRVDQYNKMVEDAKGIEVVIEKKKKERDSLMSTIVKITNKDSELKKLRKEDLLKIDKRISASTKELNDLQFDIVGANTSLNVVQSKLEKTNKEIIKVNNDIKVSKYEKILVDKQLIEKNGELEDVSGKTSNMIICKESFEKEVSELELNKSELIIEIDKKTKAGEKEVKLLKEESINIEETNQRGRELTFDLERQVKELQLSKDSKLKEFADRQLELDQSFGELSLREKELNMAKGYLAHVIKQLSEIDPKKLSKIDLSKI